jgi:hypothetical protein
LSRLFVYMDACLVGYPSQVEHKHGNIFPQEVTTAMASSADAFGIISWNEFSVNTHIEPSKSLGSQSLHVLSGIASLCCLVLSLSPADKIEQIVSKRLNGFLHHYPVRIGVL